MTKPGIRMRPADSTGDILPVLSVSSLLSGPEAVAALVRDRLNLLAGEWWENPSHGCGILDMLREGRMTGADKPALASALTAYISATPGVQAAEDVSADIAGREFRYSCTVRTAAGSTGITCSISA